jgi:hypothetical protein
MDLSAEGLSIQGGLDIIAFDTWGRPYSDNNSILQTSLTSPHNIILQDADGNSESIRLTQETGFIP